MRRLLILLVCMASFCAVSAQETVVYVVRHAEKHTSNPSDKDPDLNEAGFTRARQLDSLLAKENFSAVFSTNYKRTKNTAWPIATRNKKEILVYQPSDFNGVANRVWKEFKGKKVLIVGHSNTVPQILEALGGDPGMMEIDETQYRLLFKVSQGMNGETRTQVIEFGN